MKIKFDPNQKFQLDAVQSLVDLYDGQTHQTDDYTIELNVESSGLFQTELGYANDVTIDDETMVENMKAIQARNDLDLQSQLIKKSSEKDAIGYQCPNISIEMETGTGKTYVYIRSILEMSRVYGFKKYIIVVPSVAIREGVLKTLEITNDHFRSVYNNIEYEYFVYDSTKPGRLRSFATSNKIQIMIINIDAFRKDFSDSEDAGKSNVIFKESDRLSGRKPIEFIQHTRPFVIIDEPQSVDNTPKSQQAIQQLSPSAIWRYSATHTNAYNIIYKLDPVKAFEMGLVKQIVVASVVGEKSHNDAYVKLLAVDNKNGLKAQIEIHIHTPTGSKAKKLWVKSNTDLFSVSKQKSEYREGFEIVEINAEKGNEYIEFSTQGRLSIGQERGGIREDLMSVQIRNTVKKHLDKQLQVREKGIKVLTLFFIDRVSNYKIYGDDGSTAHGIYAVLFEQHYQELIKLPQYLTLLEHDLSLIHDGYFSADKRGIVKDTNGNTQADNDTYTKIMKNKEQLLSMDEPLQFIFSHSALREGWDNPNVFQICTLNETVSTIKKRQEIGRGLRLPVNQLGERVFDKNINKLTVIANESYDVFARKLQTEYEEDCGVTFGKIKQGLFANLMYPETEMKVGHADSSTIFSFLVEQAFLDGKGYVTAKFNPQERGFSLGLPERFETLENDIIDTLSSYRIERHIQRDEDPRKLVLRKEVIIDENFASLWAKIQQKTTYRVAYNTSDLVAACINGIQHMDAIKNIKITYTEGSVNIEGKGITAHESKVSTSDVEYKGAMPDIISYLQRETELTRSTIVSILKGSNRLGEFILNPQKFMEQAAYIMKNELHRVMIDGIQYTKIDGQLWSMNNFEDQEILSYFHNRLDVTKSIFDAVVFDSETERRFAQKLEDREDIELFVKLPRWFTVDTPVGTYNPDWAIVKKDEETFYLICETKGTVITDDLRRSEKEKVKCGKAHFSSLDVDFKVVNNASLI
jgi:type III restriction enzyme